MGVPELQLRQPALFLSEAVSDEFPKDDEHGAQNVDVPSRGRMQRPMADEHAARVHEENLFDSGPSPSPVGDKSHRDPATSCERSREHPKRRLRARLTRKADDELMLVRLEDGLPRA